MQRIKNLDPLRGFLALCVIIYHIPAISDTVGLPSFDDLPIFNRGDNAVFVFFTLSGYLIIGLLYDEKINNNSINIKQFYIRRILRLYPVYYLVLIFGFLYYHLVLPALNISFEINYNLLEGIAWNVFFLPNVFKGLYNPGGILIILWSIGIEEQFYLFIAPLLSALPFNKYFKILLLFTIIYFIIFHIPYFSFFKKFGFLYFFMSAGGAIAILSKIGYQVHFNSFILRLLTYITFILHFFTDLFEFDRDMFNLLFEVVLYSLLIVNLVNDDRVVIKSYFFNYLGKVSYGIYMYHMIVVNVVLFVFLKIEYINNLPNWITILLINVFCLLGTIMIAHFSYQYFESYFIQLKSKFRRTNMDSKVTRIDPW